MTVWAEVLWRPERLLIKSFGHPNAQVSQECDVLTVDLTHIKGKKD